jgi:hypothetical protein
VRDLQQPAVQSPGTDLVAFAFLGLAAAVAGVQTGFLLHDARGWSEVEAGSIVSWHHIPYLESLLALVDLAVLAVAALVLLATFAERQRRPAWATLAWVLIALASFLEWRLLGLQVNVAGGDSALDLGPYYEGRSHEALGATVLCIGAVLCAAVALRPGRTRTDVGGT